MKKLCFLIILASMTFLLVSCAEKKVEPEPEPPPCEGADCEDAPPPPPEPEPEPAPEPAPEPESAPDEPDPEPEPAPEPDPEPEPEPELKETLVIRTPAQAVEEPEPELKEVLVIRTPAEIQLERANLKEQEEEEELIVEEKDADEAVQPPKAEEIMILPPEEADTAFSEMGMIYFAYDKSEITAEFEEVIQKNYEWIFQNPDAQVQLEGHCDERGTNEYNLALGERRAKAVFDYLVSLGANPSQFTIVSFGEERPVAYGSNEASWRQNRRVEFTQL